MSLPRLKFGFAFLLFVVLSGVPLGAQDGAVENAAQPTAPARIHTSPREVLDAFDAGMRRYHEFKSYDRKDLDLALSCFQLEPSGPAPEELEALAVQLYEALHRMTVVDPEALAEPGARAQEWSWIIQGEGSRTLGRVPFVRLRAATAVQSANWRFGASLLESIPRWYEVWKDEPLRSEYVERLSAEEQTLSFPGRLRRRIQSTLPEAFQQRLFLLEHWQWIALALLISLGVILGRVVNFIVRLFARRLERSERLHVDKEVLVGFERPFTLFVMGWTVRVLLPVLGVEPRIFETLLLGCAFFLSVTGVWSAYRLVDVGASILQEKANRTHNRFDDILVPLVRRIAKIFLTFVGAVYLASHLSEDLYGIVAGLSIGSLAVGFAAKDSIENLFGTMTVLLDKPYQLGDWITVGDIDGTVEEVGFRSTKIRTFYNSVISVPNSRFISAHIDNWGERRYRRIKTNVSIAYGTPPLKIEAFCEAIRELVRKHPYTRKDYYHVYLNQLGASSLDILVYCFVQTPDWSTELREKHRLFLDILRVAEGLGVELAFPTQTLHVVQDAGGTPPDIPGMTDDARGAERMGRELADLIVKEGLDAYDGNKPPPVVID